MADKDIPVGGDPSFAVHYVDLGGGRYAPAHIHVNSSGTPAQAPVAPVHAVISVLVTSTTVLAANTTRRGVLLQNLGVNPITVRLDGGAAVAGAGLILNPITTTGYGGGTLLMDSGVVTNTAITAIALTATTSLLAVEF